MFRTAIVLAALVLSAAALGSSARAGGWAVTTFDDLPREFIAGTSYTLGYTIRQHGATPVNVEHTEIGVLTATGKRIAFAGERDGVTGHYRATVIFPSAGAYRWEVTQTPFGPQDLGAVTVLAGAGGDRTVAGAPAPDPVRALLPYAAAAALALFCWRLVTIARALRRHRAIA